MSDLLAVLLTGGKFPDLTGGSRGPRPETDSAGDFEQILEAKSPRPEPDGAAPREPGDEKRHGPHRTDRADGHAGKERPAMNDGKGDAQSPMSRITLLGAPAGPRAPLPSLTFVLPAGSGAVDLAAAVRTQVLRLAAARGLEPGSLANLRLAISSRELGQVDVELRASGERLEVEITASGRDAEAVLRKTSGDLRDNLLARTDRFRQVEVRVDNRFGPEKDGDGEDRRDRPGSGHGRNENGRRGGHDGGREPAGG